MGVFLTLNGRDILNSRIGKLEEEIRKEGKVKGDAYKQGGEWHDNFAFEESSRKELSLDKQRRELREILLNATIVSSCPQNTDEVSVGCVIELEDEDGVMTEYHVVGYGESDMIATPKKLEYLAPIIQPFMNHKVGEEHTIHVGGKKTTLTLTNIRRA